MLIRNMTKTIDLFFDCETVAGNMQDLGLVVLNGLFKAILGSHFCLECHTLSRCSEGVLDRLLLRSEVQGW